MTINYKNKPKNGTASNKPPTPAPGSASPDPKVFVQSVALKDGRTIWVSLPQPDRLSFTAKFAKTDFANGKSKGSGGGLDHNVLAFAQGLAGAQAMHGTGEGYFSASGALLAKARFQLGNRGSHVRTEVFRRKPKGEPDAIYGIRLEMNPRKLGEEGFAQLLDILHYASPTPLNIAALLSGASITRLDVAIDLAGVSPEGLMLTSKEPTKRVLYVGSDGHLETVQLHRWKKAAKQPLKPRPLGTLLLKVYDRNRQREAVGKAPPVPGMSVTRLEIVKRRFGKAHGLAHLPLLANPFASLTIRDRDDADLIGNLDAWRAYVLCRSRLEKAGIEKALKLESFSAKQAAHAYALPGHSLVTSEVWAKWGDGLALSGLLGIIQLAQT